MPAGIEMQLGCCWVDANLKPLGNHATGMSNKPNVRKFENSKENSKIEHLKIPITRVLRIIGVLRYQVPGISVIDHIYQVRKITHIGRITILLYVYCSY